MKEETTASLLKRFYEGETTQEEERMLTEEFLSMDTDSPEKDYFSFLASKYAPTDLKDQLSDKLDQTLGKRKLIRHRIYTVISFAAVLVVFFSFFHDIRREKEQKLDNNFFIMEKALFQVSESLKPEKQDDLVVLWVDNNVEIIVN